jgi:hypothetical protein
VGNRLRRDWKLGGCKVSRDKDVRKMKEMT